MAVVLLGLLLLLAMTKDSSGATYCLCRDGMGDSVLQKSIDYACGNGADCTPIVQGGSCYNPNTIKDHCNYAVNSYFQKKGQTAGSCDFSGSATPSANPPTPTSGCVYPTSASGGTPTAPGTGTGTPGTGTPGTGTPGMGTPGTGTGTGTGTGFVPGSPFPGLGPTGGINNPDGSGSGRLSQATSLFYSLTLALSLSGLLFLRG